MTLIRRAKPILTSLGKHWQKEQLVPHWHSGLGWQGRGSSVLLMNIKYMIKPFRCSRQVGYTLGSISNEIRASSWFKDKTASAPSVCLAFFLFLRI